MEVIINTIDGNQYKYTTEKIDDCKFLPGENFLEIVLKNNTGKIYYPVNNIVSWAIVRENYI